MRMSARQKSPARTHQSVMPVHRHRVAPYPARKPCVADRQRARKRSDAAICHPRLSCTQGATGVQSSRKGYRFVHTRDGRVHLPVFYTTPNPPQRQGRLVVLPPGIRPPDSHASRHGQPSVRRKRQCDENSRNKQLEGVRLSSSSCGSRPTLLPGINARPSRLALPGPPRPHHHSRPGPKMRPKMLEESCPCRKRRSHWSSGVLVLVDDASGPVASSDPEGLEVGYLGWKRLERCGAG